MASQPPPHVVIFPFLSQGHTLPLLDLSKAFSRRALRESIVTTPSNPPLIFPYISKHPEIHLIEIPFPDVDGLPKGCENTAHLPSMDLLIPFMKATVQLQQPFDRILRKMAEDGSHPICVISDFFLGWTLTTCRKIGIPRLVFHGMGALSMAISKSIWKNKLHRTPMLDNESLHLPETPLPFTLTRSDLPEIYRFLDDNSPLPQFLAESGETDVDSYGVILNSFAELEGHHVPFFESFYKNGAMAWCVGPLFLYDDMDETNEAQNKCSPTTKCIIWLDDHVSRSSLVIYVPFGTQFHLSNDDLDEVAFGLEMSRHNFIWVIRSRTWLPPDGLEESVKGRGMIINDWVEQRCILAHQAIGGFLSHCGWNSVLESLSIGVPLLALPLNAEQPLNARLVVDELEAGVRVPVGPPSGFGIIAIKKEAIRDGVRELMGGEKGRKAKKKAKELGRAAKRAVEEGGSSYKSLGQLVDHLCNK